MLAFPSHVQVGRNETFSKAIFLSSSRVVFFISLGSKRRFYSTNNILTLNSKCISGKRSKRRMFCVLYFDTTNFILGIHSFTHSTLFTITSSGLIMHNIAKISIPSNTYQINC